MLLDTTSLFKILSTRFSWVTAKFKIPSFFRLILSNSRVSFRRFSIDESFPVSQSLISGFENPIRLDRYSSGCGKMLYIRKSSGLSANTEAFLAEAKIGKKMASLL